MLSGQYGKTFTGSHYEKLYKVYSIFICANPPKARHNTVNSYQITEKNLMGHAKEKKKRYDLLTAVMICLGDPQTAETGGFIRLLDVLLSKTMKSDQKLQILRDEYQIPTTYSLEGKVKQMCNLSEGVWSDGHKVGRKEGRKEGQQEEAQKIAINLAKLNIPLEKIAEATQKSITVVKKWIEMDGSKISGDYTKA
jgi:hypothetical protein